VLISIGRRAIHRRAEEFSHIPPIAHPVEMIAFYVGLDFLMAGFLELIGTHVRYAPSWTGLVHLASASALLSTSDPGDPLTL